MLIGVNITSATSFRHAERFWHDGLIDFFELLIDNFLHLDPKLIARTLDGKPTALHIMTSRFLHRNAEELDAIAHRLRDLCDILSPLYVSDHLACHELKGQLLPELVEVNYQDEELVSSIARWRDLIGAELLLENFPSSGPEGKGQVDFFKKLHHQGIALPLLDFSNAVISENNGGDAVESWVGAGLPLTACHISGYRPSAIDPEFLVDSHDCAVSERSWRLFERSAQLNELPHTLVIERDANLDEAAWIADLRRARGYAA